MTDIRIDYAWRPGALARCLEMHARFYAREAGFGRAFEAKVAAGLAEFADRWDNPSNRFWLALRGDDIVGTIAIDGEDIGGGRAHLRWFIIDDGLRGSGAGARLIAAAVDFCDGMAFEQTHLWTFRGLDAARRLYERNGFELAQERPGGQWGVEVMEQEFVRPRGGGAN